MKTTYSVRIANPGSYLSHKGKTTFCRATARKHLADWLQVNPGSVAWIENERGEPSPSPERLESRARRLRSLRLVDPQDYRYRLADRLTLTAQTMRKTAR